MKKTELLKRLSNNPKLGVFKSNNPICEDKQFNAEGIDYANVKNPKSNKRYIIPNLSPTDPIYLEKYASTMYLQDHNKELFDKIINWD